MNNKLREELAFLMYKQTIKYSILEPFDVTWKRMELEDKLEYYGQANEILVLLKNYAPGVVL